MKQFILTSIFFMSFLSSGYSQTIHAYSDPVTLGSKWAEAEGTRQLRKAHEKTDKEVKKIVPTATVELLSRKSKPIITPTLYALDPSIQSLCDGFTPILGHNKRIKCMQKRDYILEAARVANVVMNTPVQYTMSNGQLDILLQKYIAIIHRCEQELEQMKIERDKRTFIRNLLE